MNLKHIIRYQRTGMITNNLFNNVLIDPVNNGANKLYIVTGYATAAMAYKHLNKLIEINRPISIELIIGMSSLDGISEGNHKAFCKLIQSNNPVNFSCYYYTEIPPVHSKVYSWFVNDSPYKGFIGSANYTQVAFYNNLREAMDETNPSEGLNYYNSLIPNSIYCNNIEANNVVKIFNDRIFEKNIPEVIEEQKVNLDESKYLKFIGLPHVNLSFLDKNGNLPQRSGLNWGQRKEYGREPNQAYIKLTSNVYNSNFFPDRRIHFTVLTDDEKVLICSRAQDNAKAIHTPQNNSILGRYFRYRLGVASGSPVSLEDLKRYGRTDVDFYKIDDETYYMDFSVPKNG